MRTRAAAISLFGLVLSLAASPARAQYAVKGPSDPATGERYHVEIGGFLWNPTPDIVISSESLGIVGSDIDFVNDLGIEKTRFKQIRVVLRPATKHKFRFEYTPIHYDAVGQLTADVIFNGIRFPVTVPVTTNLQWKAYRFGYEYDFVSRDRGFVGLILEAKYTDVQATLSQAALNISEFARARAPIPAIGGIARVYIVPNISITGEFSGIKLPESINEDYRAKYYDLDIYGTVNFTDHVGAQAGYRSFDVLYKVEKDAGNLQLKGLYLGGIVRF
jgi:hypothetical protein